MRGYLMYAAEASSFSGAERQKGNRNRRRNKSEGAREQEEKEFLKSSVCEKREQHHARTPWRAIRLRETFRFVEKISCPQYPEVTSVKRQIFLSRAPDTSDDLLQPFQRHLSVSLFVSHDLLDQQRPDESAHAFLFDQFLLSLSLSLSLSLFLSLFRFSSTISMETSPLAEGFRLCTKFHPTKLEIFGLLWYNRSIKVERKGNVYCEIFIYFINYLTFLL